MRCAEPDMPTADQDRYFAEMVRVAEPLGADPIPRTKAEAQAMIETIRPHPLCDARTREVVKLVMTQRAPNLLVEPLHALTMQAGVDLLPEGGAWVQFAAAEPPACSCGDVRDRSDVALGVPVVGGLRAGRGGGGCCGSLGISGRYLSIVCGMCDCF